jgi:hypothetical protein
MQRELWRRIDRFIRKYESTPFRSQLRRQKKKYQASGWLKMKVQSF